MKKYLSLIILFLSAAVFFSCEEPEPVFEGATSFKVDKSLVKFTAKAGNEILTLTTDAQTWTVTSGADWLSVDPVTGSGDAQITVSVPANQSARRSTSVTFSTEGMKDIVVTVIQEEGEKPGEKTGLYSDPEEIGRAHV